MNLDYEQTTIILGKIPTLSIICLHRIVLSWIKFDFCIHSNSFIFHSDGSKKSLPFLKDENNSEDLSISYQTETHLVSLLNQLCSRLMEKDNAKLLDVFFHASQNMSSESGNTGKNAFEIFNWVCWRKISCPK